MSITHVTDLERQLLSQITIKDNVAAVDQEYFWRHMNSCPKGVKVQLYGVGGVAVYALFDGKNRFWKGWAPCPSVPDWMKEI